MLFHDAHHIFIYLVGDIAFVFLEVLLVTLIIHQLLSRSGKKQRLKKLNMVVGTFFSEVGTSLLKLLAAFDRDADILGKKLKISGQWPRRDFAQALRYVRHYEGAIDSEGGDLAGLKAFLAQKRDFVLRLLENPHLLEYESLTDLLWAVTHIQEELAGRTRTQKLPTPDYRHLSGDIRRAYVVLIREWLRYLVHLQESYPYLYSLAIRTNPFDSQARVDIS